MDPAEATRARAGCTSGWATPSWARCRTASCGPWWDPDAQDARALERIRDSGV